MMNMGQVKKFLKPDWRKIVLIVVLFFIATSLTGKLNKEIDNNPLYGPIGFFMNNRDVYKEWGFPLKWLKIGGGEKIISLSLVGDLIFWYFISCLLIFVWDKIKNKKK